MNNIAIIGISGRAAGSDNVNTIWDDMLKGRDMVREFPESRLEELKTILGDIPQYKFVREGYVSQTISFEPELFSIGHQEAAYIDPQQRMLLELVEEAINDAGYTAEELQEKICGVYVSENHSEYLQYMNKKDILGIINGIPSMNSARISYVFGLKGPSLSIGAACASSLSAVHLACQSLLSGESDYALAGGVRLFFVPFQESEIPLNPTVSPNQRIRAFDAAADGIIGGEGGGIVLLKPLDMAIRDRDNIHAVIKGSAITNNGLRSNGIAAPNEEAQADAVRRAIKVSDVDAGTISYVEAHGSGTRIGDSIEWKALGSVYGRTDREQALPVGSIKTNIGHLDTAAGIMGLLKVVLAIKNSKIPASLHYSNMNADCKSLKLPMYVPTSAESWQPVVKRAGLSSTGLTGTNIHMILEQAPVSALQEKTDKPEQHLLFITARTEWSLQTYLQHLKNHLERNLKLSVGDIAFSLNTGRRNLGKMVIFKVRTVFEILKQINDGTYNYIEEKSLTGNIAVVVPDICSADFSEAAVTNIKIPFYTEYLSAWESRLTGELPPRVRWYVASLCAYMELIEKCCRNKIDFIGIGTGYEVIQFYMNSIGSEECVRSIMDRYEQMDTIDNGRIDRLFSSMKEYGNKVFALLLFDETLKALFEKKQQEYPETILTFWAFDQEKYYDSMIALAGKEVRLNPAMLVNVNGARRISLPPYCFDRRQYYVKPERTDVRLFVKETSGNYTEGAATSSVESWLHQLLQKAGKVHIDDYSIHFFDLGLSSMMIIYIISQINEKYGIKLPITMFFEDNTYGKFVKNAAKRIKDHLNTQIIPDKQYTDLSDAQARMYAIYLQDTASTKYNTTFGYCINGPFDMGRAQNAFQAVVQRHDMLRSSIRNKDGKFMRRIEERVEVHIECIGDNAMSIQEVKKLFVRQFDLSLAPLIRVLVTNNRTGGHFMLIDVQHIVADGVSMAIILRDFINIYEGRELAELNRSYAEYVKWEQDYQRQEAFAKQEKYWLENLSGYVKLNIQTDFPRKKIRQASAQTSVTQIEIIKGALLELSNKCGTTLSTLYLSVFMLVLAEQSQQYDITAGMIASGRYHWSTEEVVGLFVNILPIRMQINNTDTFNEHLQRVHNKVLLALENQEYPYSKINRIMDGRNQKTASANEDMPVLPAVFSLVEAEEQYISVDGLELQPVRLYPEEWQFELMFEISQYKEWLEIGLTYAEDLFDKQHIVGFLERYSKIIEMVISDSYIKIERLINIENKDILFDTADMPITF